MDFNQIALTCAGKGFNELLKAGIKYSMTSLTAQSGHLVGEKQAGKCF